MNSKESKINSQVIYSIIGVAIMILFPLLPISLPKVTEVGMQIIGIFIGTLFLWTTVDPLWSSLICIAMIGFSSFGTMSEVLVAYFGNATVVQMFFMMIFIGTLVYEKITLYIGRFFLTRDIANGRPWMLTFMIMVGSYIMGVFINPFASIFLFWPIMYGVFEQVGFKKDDKYPKILIILIVIAALLGFPVAPYMLNALALLGNYRKIAEGAVLISDGSYFVVCFLMGFILLVAMILISKYILRPDTEALKAFDVEALKKTPLPKMNTRQKVLTVAFVIYIAVMLFPTLLTGVPGMAFLAQNSMGFALFFVAILAAIPIDGQPVLNFSKVMEKDFAWSTFFLCATAILLGSVLTNEATGISAFLNVMLSPIFNGMSSTVFTIVLLVVAVLLTNICNSLVIGMILQPVVLNYCTAAGVNAAPIITLLIFTVLLSAAITPAASPFAAMMFGNKERLKSTDVYKYTSIYVVAEVILILLIGLPLANLMM